MSKKLKPILAVLLVGLVVFATAAFAAGQTTQVNVYDRQNQLVKSVVFVIGQKQYFVNGQTPGTQMNVAPYTDQGRTFVPVRYLGNALGVDDQHIGWNNGTNTATLTLNTTTAALTIGKAQIVTNGTAKAIDVAPELKQNRTFLPARYVAEALGYQVDYKVEGNTGFVICWPQGAQEPDISKVVQYVKQNPAPVVTQPATDNPPAQTTQPTTGTGGGTLLGLPTGHPINDGGGPVTVENQW